MYNCFKELSTDIVFNVLYIYIFFILFYIMYNIHVVKRFRAHCGFYAIENKLLLLLLLLSQVKGLTPVCLMYFETVGSQTCFTSVARKHGVLSRFFYLPESAIDLS